MLNLFNIDCKKYFTFFAIFTIIICIFFIPFISNNSISSINSVSTGNTKKSNIPEFFQITSNEFLWPLPRV